MLAVMGGLAATPAGAAPLLIAEVGTSPFATPMLRPLFSHENGRWRGVDAQIAEAVRAGRLPDTSSCDKTMTVDPIASPAFAQAVFGAPVDLRQWHWRNHQGVYLIESASDALPFGKPCEREWGLRFAKDWTKGRLLSVPAIEMYEFRSYSADDGQEPRPTEGAWLLASPTEEAEAFATFRRTHGAARADALGAVSAAQLASLSLGYSWSRAELHAYGSLVWVEADRRLFDRPMTPGACNSPELVYSALFHIGADGAVTRVDNAVEARDCESHTVPRRRHEPRAVLRIDGEFWLLARDTFAGTSNDEIYSLDATSWKPAARPAACRGSDCLTTSDHRITGTGTWEN